MSDEWFDTGRAIVWGAVGWMWACAQVASSELESARHGSWLAWTVFTVAVACTGFLTTIAFRTLLRMRAERRRGREHA
jgi:hypothetical protein